MADQKVELTQVSIDQLIRAMCASCLNPAIRQAQSDLSNVSGQVDSIKDSMQQKNAVESEAIKDQIQRLNKYKSDLKDIEKLLENVSEEARAGIKTVDELTSEYNKQKEDLLNTIREVERQNKESIISQASVVRQSMYSMFDELDGSFDGVEDTIRRINQISASGDYGKKAANKLGTQLVEQFYGRVQRSIEEQATSPLYAMFKGLKDKVTEFGNQFKSILSNQGGALLNSINPAKYMSSMEGLTGAGTISQTYELKQLAFQIGELSGTSKTAAEKLYNFDSSVASTGFATSKYQKNVIDLQKSGIKNLQSALDISKSQLFLEKQLGLESGELQNNFREMKMEFMLSDAAIGNLAINFSKIAKSAGLTGAAMKQAADMTQQTAKKFQEFRGLTPNVLENLQKLSAEAIKNGIQGSMSKLQESMQGLNYDLTEGADTRLIALRNRVAQFAGGQEMLAKALNGTLLESSKDMKVFAAGFQENIENMTGHSIEDLDKLTGREKILMNQRIKSITGFSLDEMLKQNKSLKDATKGSSDKLEDLTAQQKKYQDELNKGGLSTQRKKFLEDQISDKGDLAGKKTQIKEDQQAKQAKVFNDALMQFGGDSAKATEVLLSQFETKDLAVGGITNFDPKTIQKQMMASNAEMSKSITEKAEKLGIQSVESNGETFGLEDVKKMLQSNSAEERQKGLEVYNALYQKVTTQQGADKNPMAKFQKMMDELSEKLLKVFVPVFEDIMSIVVPAMQTLGNVIGGLIKVFKFLNDVTGGLVGKVAGFATIGTAFVAFAASLITWGKTVWSFSLAVAKFAGLSRLGTGTGTVGNAPAGGGGGGGGWGAGRGGKIVRGVGKAAGIAGAGLMVANMFGYDPIAAAAQGLGASEDTANTVSNAAGMAMTVGGFGLSAMGSGSGAAAAAAAPAAAPAAAAVNPATITPTAPVAPAAPTSMLGKIGGFARRIPVLGTALGGIMGGVDEYQKSGSAGRSLVAGGSTALGTALGGALGTLIPIPVLGTAIGATAGGALGGYLGQGLNYIGAGGLIDKGISGIGSAWNWLTGSGKPAAPPAAAGVPPVDAAAAAAAGIPAAALAGGAGAALAGAPAAAGAAPAAGGGAIAAATGSAGSTLLQMTGITGMLGSLGLGWLVGKDKKAVEAKKDKKDEKVDLSQQAVDVLNKILDVLKSGAEKGGKKIGNLDVNATTAAASGKSDGLFGLGRVTDNIMNSSTMKTLFPVTTGLYEKLTRDRKGNAGGSDGSFGLLGRATDNIMNSSTMKTLFPVTTGLYEKLTRDRKENTLASAVDEKGNSKDAKATPVGLNGYVASNKTKMAYNSMVSAKIGTGSEADMQPVTQELNTQTQIATSQLETLKLIAYRLSGSSSSSAQSDNIGLNPQLDRVLNTSLPKGAMAYSTAAQQTSGAAGNPISYGI